MHSPELKKIEKLFAAFSIINPNVRFTIHHNKSNIFTKIACSTLGQSFGAVLGQTSKSQMNEFAVSIDPATGDYNEIEGGMNAEPTSDLHVRIVFPKKSPGMSVEFGRTNVDKTFVFVNKRPVEMKGGYT